MTSIMQQKQKIPIPIGCLLCQSPKPHQNSEFHQNLKHHRPPSDPAFECAFNTFSFTLLGWEQKRTLIMNLSSRFYDLLVMRGTGRYMGTGPRRAVGSSVIVRVLLRRLWYVLARKEEMRFRKNIQVAKEKPPPPNERGKS